MARTVAYVLPAGLRGLLTELASADSAAEQRWILSLLQDQGPMVLTLLWRMLGREEDVLDVYQSVVCQMTAGGRDAIGRNPGAYFYRASINTAIELMRRRRRERNRMPAVAERRSRSHAPLSPGANLEHLDLVDRLRTAVASLPQHLRDVVLLHDMGGLDYRSVAGCLNITAGTARVYRRQAIVRLSARLSKEALG